MAPHRDKVTDYKYPEDVDEFKHNIECGVTEVGHDGRPLGPEVTKTNKALLHLSLIHI